MRADVCGPSIDERLERFTSMGGRLGALTPGAMWLDDEGAVSMSVSTAQEGPATFIFETNRDNPPRLPAVKVLVGG